MSNNSASTQPGGFFAKPLAPEHRHVLVPGLLGLLAFGAGIWWLLRSDYVDLDAPVNEITRAEALATLQKAGIEYRASPDGSIQVERENAAQARALLTELGLSFPPPTGYELFDKSDYTLSDFSQRINYQRALEGELARTIMGLREVRSARVHLLLPKQDLFGANKTAAKASVTVQLKPGQDLSDESAGGIRDIVASSVEGLKAENIAILDDGGTPIHGGLASGGYEQNTRAARQTEVDLERRVRQLLKETWHVQDAYVSVRADLNFDHVTAVRDGAVPVADSDVGLVTREQISDGAASKDGIAGASTATREYVYTHERVETEFATGKLARLSIAVALPAGSEALDLAALESVIGAAIGLRAERGDKLVVTRAGSTLAPINALPGNTVPGTNENNTTDVQTASPSATTPAPTTNASANDNSRTFVIAALVLALCIALFFAIRPRRQPSAQRMSAEQREQLLADLQKWANG